MDRFSPATACLLSLAVVGVISSAAARDDGYQEELNKWRQKRLETLKADDGWLTVSGLFWLKPGVTKIGSDPSNDVLLPARTPAMLGTLELEGGKATFRPDPAATLTCNGKAFSGGEVHSDASGHADVLAVGDVKLILLKRGDRFALRLKDNQSPIRSHFAGLRWYPPREDWRVVGRFVPFAAPTKMVMDTIVGGSDVAESPGLVEFEHDGKTYKLQAIAQKDGSLWFVFRDRTSGRTTHGGARQLDADAPRNGIVILDFNKATNLPCAYIPYATCPIAPPQNRLSVAVEAGELKYEPLGDESRAAGQAAR
jgi:uncharacterized protein (DUF1684 family)